MQSCSGPVKSVTPAIAVEWGSRVKPVPAMELKQGKQNAV